MEAVLLQALSESLAVVNAEGIILPDTLSNIFAGFDAKVLPEYKPSLLLDLERGNRLEVEAISGVVSRLGKKSGIPTPINDLVYACLKPYANGTPSAS